MFTKAIAFIALNGCNALNAVNAVVWQCVSMSNLECSVE